MEKLAKMQRCDSPVGAGGARVPTTARITGIWPPPLVMDRKGGS